jgi:hypothetical protein
MTPPAVQQPLPGAAQLAGNTAQPPPSNTPSNTKARAVPPAPTGTATGRNAPPAPVKPSKLRQPRQARGPKKP